MIGKWIHLATDGGEQFMVGEIVATHGDYFEFRPVHLDADDDAGEPPFTFLADIADLTQDGSRLFESEQALRNWLAWLFRPETPKELAAQGRHLRPVK